MCRPFCFDRETLMSDKLSIHIEDRIATLCIRRPEVHNAIDGETMDLLGAALDRIESEDARAVIITGSGEETFCSGGDLRWFASFTEEKHVLHMAHRMQKLLDRLFHAPRVVIGAVNGNSYGGGCEILTACHFRFSVPEARFSFKQAANGIITGWGGGLRLFRLVGRTNALRFLVTAESFEAEKARALGFVDEIVPREILMDAARFLAQKVIANDPSAVAAFLDLAHAVHRDDTESFREREIHHFSSCWHGATFQDILTKYR